MVAAVLALYKKVSVEGKLNCDQSQIHSHTFYVIILCERTESVDRWPEGPVHFLFDNTVVA